MLSEAAQRVFFFVARAAMLTSHATALHDVVRNRGTNMQGKIALEEHFAIEPTLGDSQLFGSHVWKDLSHRLLDIQETRLGEMDKHGIEMMILSLNAPAIQAIPDSRNIDVAKQANDVLAGEVRKRPNRFAAFAALPMQDPDAATAELTRCVKELGMVGALVNGFSQAGTPNNISVLRPSGLSAVLARDRSTRRAVLSAPAQSTAAAGPSSTRATVGCSARIGPLLQKRPSTLCG